MKSSFGISPFLLVILVACLSSAVSAAGFLEWYDGFALIGIWRVMTSFFYKMIASYVCANYGGILITMVGASLVSDAAVTANEDNVAEVCQLGFDNMYAAVWYKTGEVVYTYGDDDYYNYTI